jgi:hypothetical protein
MADGCTSVLIITTEQQQWLLTGWFFGPNKLIANARDKPTNSTK